MEKLLILTSLTFCIACLWVGYKFNKKLLLADKISLIVARITYMILALILPFIATMLLVGLISIAEYYGVELYFGHAMEEVFGTLLLAGIICVIAGIFSCLAFRSTKSNSSSYVEH